MVTSKLVLDLADVTGPGKVGEILIRPLSTSENTAYWQADKAGRIPLKYNDPDHASTDPAYAPTYTVLGEGKWEAVVQGAWYEFTVVRVNSTTVNETFEAQIPAGATSDFSDLSPLPAPLPNPVDIVDSAFAAIIAGPSQSHDAVIDVAEPLVDAEATARANADAAALVKANASYSPRIIPGSEKIKHMADDAVISSPPTISATASVPAGYTQVRQFDVYGFDKWSGFRISGGPVSATRLPVGVTSSGVQVAPGQPMILEFDHDGDSFVFSTQAKTTSVFTVWVNEEKHNATPQLLSSVSGVSGTGTHAYKVDFGSRAPRRIRVEIQNQPNLPCSFNGLNIKPVDGCLPPAIASPRMVVVGDSYDYGIGTALVASTATFDTANAWPYWLGRYLGIADVWNFAGIPSTGFVAVHPVNSAGPYSGRRADVLAALRPGDILVLQGSINDGASGIVAGVSAAVQAEVAYYRANAPGVFIAVTSPLYMKNPTADHIASYNAVVAGTTAAAVTFLDVFKQTMKFFYGAGNVGATTGDGNADFYGANESPNPSQHPSPAGHKALGRALAAQLSKAIWNHG